MVGESIRNSDFLNGRYETKYINLSLSKRIHEIGKINIGKFHRYFALLIKVLSICLFWKPSLVYITPDVAGKGFYKDFVLVSLMKFFGHKVLIHLHNKGVRYRVNGLIQEVFFRSFFSGVRVILLAKELYSDISEYVDEKNIRICHNGITRLWDLPVKSHCNTPKFLFLSNLIEEKGLKQILEACEELKESNIDFELNIVGGEADWSSSRLNKEIQTRGLALYVQYYGRLVGEAKAKMFMDSDIFVFPTYYSKECLPLVVIEAMQFGLAVISTREGGIPSLVEDGYNGILIEAKKSDALAKAMIKLQSDSVMLETFSQNAVSTYMKNFTQDHFEKRLQIILDEYLRYKKV